MHPIHCHFGIRKACNLQCSYCDVSEYNKSGQKNDDERALEAVQQFVEKVKREKLNLCSVTLHEAESGIVSARTLGKLINLLVEPAHNDVRIQSHGTRFTPAYLDELLEEIEDPQKLYVGINMDGGWDLVTRNIEELRKRNFKAGILTVVTPLTIKHLKDFENWTNLMRSCGHSLTFKLGERGYGLNKQESEQFADWLYESKNVKSLQAFMPNLCIHDGNACEFYEFDLDGHCYSCNKSHTDVAAFANWFKESFEEIISKRKKLYKNTMVSTECSLCSYQTICQSGCPLSREEGKSIDCAIKKRLYPRLIKEGILSDRFFAIERQPTIPAVLRSVFPSLFAQWNEDQGQDLIDDFLKQYVAREANYRQIVFDFFQFLEKRDFHEDVLRDLANFEYDCFSLLSSETRLLPMDRREKEDSETLIGNARLIFNPDLLIKRYKYPVHTITAKTDQQAIASVEPCEPGEPGESNAPRETEILIYRNPRDQEIYTMALTPLTHKFIHTFLENRKWTFSEGLQRLISELPEIETQDLINDSLAFLKNLYERNIIVSLR